MLNNIAMEAQRMRIALLDESAGYAITPQRVPLAVLRAFTKDVDELLRGDVGAATALCHHVGGLEPAGRGPLGI